MISFKSGTNVLDVGTGGGFPGIPLAIMFPDVHFTLVDSIAKKIKVVNQIANEAAIKNVTAVHTRAEKVNGKYDFVVSRAVTRLSKFISWTRKKTDKKNINDMPNGILYLKGGDITEELEEIQTTYYLKNLSDFFEEEFFETKVLIHIPL
jgi:16S rRNA (guanine527-N7)-methyltransferase